MTTGNEEPEAPIGSSVVMECGHRIRLPWGCPPEAVGADLLHHRETCMPDGPTVRVDAFLGLVAWGGPR